MAHVVPPLLSHLCSVVWKWGMPQNGNEILRRKTIFHHCDQPISDIYYTLW
jgi:hypothetical protein